jgi:hypothetical protein
MSYNFQDDKRALLDFVILFKYPLFQPFLFRVLCWDTVEQKHEAGQAEVDIESYILQHIQSQ